MDDLGAVNEILLWTGVALALATVGVVLFQHPRAGLPAKGWLVACSLAFAVASLPIAQFGFDLESSDNAYAWRIVPLCVFALPGLLAGLVRSLCESGSRLHRATDVLTLTLIAVTLGAPEFPGGRSEELPTWYYATIVGFLIQIALAVAATWRSIRASVADQPAPTRLRGGCLLATLAIFATSYAAWVIAPTPIMSTLTSATQLISGVLLVVALLAPRALLLALARTREGAEDDVFEALVRSVDVRADLPVLLQRAAHADGLLGMAVLDSDGEVLEIAGASALATFPARATHELRIASRPGDSELVVWSTPLTPPLRSADRARLSLLATLVQMAIARDSVAAHERAAAATLLDANDRLSEANDLKDRFVALVSHELRTPLTSIIGLARTSYERWTELDPEQVREFQRLIAEQGERLAQIVEHLLLVSAIEAGAITADIAPIDLHDVVRTAIEDAGVAATTDASLPPELHTIDADGRLIREILVNFLSNADKYAAPPFCVHANVLGEHLELVVRDEGSGVTPELRGRLFERFTRDPAAVVPGTGLGLAIAHDLATAMDGCVGHRDAPGGGSEFWLRIPLKQSEPPADTNLPVHSTP